MSDLQIISVIGVDTGETCGISFLDYIGKQLAGTMQIQVDHLSAIVLLECVLTKHYQDPRVVGRFAEVEAFKTGQSAGAKVESGDLTRQLSFKFMETLQLWGYHTQLRKAADIKPWADDNKLKKAGLYREKTGMRHANDASRHGLYCACHDAYRPNPLR